METISTILSALANTDSGTLAVPLDPAIYREDVVRSFAGRCAPCHATLATSPEGLLITLTATDPASARVEIGNALADLLQAALRHRA
jgi:hypothetical protein